MRQVLFSSSEESLEKIKTTYKKRVPAPLSSQFENRATRDEAIRKTAARKRKVAELFPSGGVFLYVIYLTF